jgi:phytanoyl-CoA hydroxylase
VDVTAARAAFARQGFVVIPGFLDDSELAELCGQLGRYIGDVVPNLPETHAFYHDRDRPETLKQMQHMQGDSFFREYTCRAKWRELAQALLGEPATCEAPEWFNKPPGVDHPTPPHQDNYYFNLHPPSVVTLWLALDPVDEENGCLRYVVGSHLAGFRPHARSRVLGFSQGITDFGPDDAAREVQVHLAPGDLTAHHGMTIHRADPNRSLVRNRRAFAMVFKGQSCRRDEEAFARYQSAMRAQHEELGLQTS